MKEKVYAADRKKRWYQQVIFHFMHRSMNELRYIETQIFQVFQALLHSIDEPEKDPVRLRWTVPKPD